MFIIIVIHLFNQVIFKQCFAHFDAGPLKGVAEKFIVCRFIVWHTFLYNFITFYQFIHKLCDINRGSTSYETLCSVWLLYHCGHCTECTVVYL